MSRADTGGIGNLSRDRARVVSDVPKTFAQAAKSVARASGTEAKREITAIYNIKQGRVGESLISYAKGSEVITTGKAKGITLQSFGGKQSAKGYTAAVKKGRRKLNRRGFTPAKFNGLPFDSGNQCQSDILRVGVAIAVAQNPALKIVRIKDGSLLDGDAKAQLLAMLAEHGFQAFIETVADCGLTALTIEETEVA